MTNEEAIKILEKQFDKSCGNYRYQNAEKLDFEDALWVAISALRQQEHFRDLTKKVEPMTNADRIRAMSDEELVKMLWKTGRNYRAVCADPVVDFNEYHDDLLDWLQQPAEEDEAK